MTTNDHKKESGSSQSTVGDKGRLLVLLNLGGSSNGQKVETTLSDVLLPLSVF